MDNARMMLTGTDPMARKRQLAARVESALDICDYCLQRPEEFFNKCHGEGGRFCGGPGSKGGPGTRRPAPIDYIEQRVGTAISTHEGRKRSASVTGITTGALRRVLGFSTAYGSVKLNKLSKTKLTSFTDKDLVTVRTQLMSDQRRYNLLHTRGWMLAATGFVSNVGKGASVAGPAGVAAVAAGALLGASVAIGLARWKTRRIPGQISRIERELTKRGHSFEGGTIEFAAEENNLPSLAEEIAQAKKDIQAGNGPKSPALSAADRAELRKMVDALQVDSEEGITAGMIKDLKKSLTIGK